MAAQSQMRGSSIRAGCLIRGFSKLWGSLRDPTQTQYLKPTVFPGLGKFVHSSVYEKNEDDGVQLNKVPQEVVHPESQKSWIPHPKTGVFGPAEDHSWTGGGGHYHSDENSKSESVLEQHVWFRSLEDVQKQPYN